jgi:hypothetical protein
MADARAEIEQTLADADDDDQDGGEIRFKVGVN